MTIQRKHSSGFTLVEMMVIAPVVILMIGTFIGLVVNLTGEVMSSRGQNMLTYSLQDALNRIEQDVKLSAAFLPSTASTYSSIDISETKQGYGGTTTAGSTVDFSNVDKTSSGGSPASLILRSVATSANPLSTTSQYIYLADQPNACSTGVQTYSKNKPMAIGVVYFVDTNNTLWRRVLMPSTYTNSSTYCGSNAPWQIPTCINGYNPASLPFCRANDEKLVSGVAPNDFTIQYYSSAATITPNSTATNPSATDADRATALLGTPTVEVNMTATQTIAGRTITKSGSVRATRLDINASAINQNVAITSAPNAPIPTGSVSNGHIVTVTWPQVDGASSYKVRYKINSGSWSSYSPAINNTTRSYTISAGNHSDTVSYQVVATNSFGDSSPGESSTKIPLWATLPLKTGWYDYGAPFSPAGYTKTNTGMVLIRGLVKNATAPSQNDIIGTLPSDYAPDGKLIFATQVPGAGGGRVNVEASGDITFYTGGGAGDWMTLDPIRYIAASASSYTRTLPTLLNSWVDYGSDFQGATYVQDSIGRVYIEGLIKNGVNTDGTVIFNLPANLAPPQYLLPPVRYVSNVSAYLAIRASSPAVLTRGLGSNGWVSLNMIYLPASASVTWNNLTLSASWVSYGDIYSTPQYTKTSDNIVHLKGLIKSGTTTDGTQIAAALPAGYRPAYRSLTNIALYNGNCRLDIYNTGAITITNCTNNSWLSLDGIAFPAEQ